MARRRSSSITMVETSKTLAEPKNPPTSPFDASLEWGNSGKDVIRRYLFDLIEKWLERTPFLDFEDFIGL